MQKRFSVIRARIDASQIHFLKFILEAYDNVAFMSTVDRTQGVVDIIYPEPFDTDVRDLLASLAGRLQLKEADTSCDT